MQSDWEKWNCLDAVDREWARRRVHQDKPELLVVCPPCTLFSSLQNLSKNGLPPVRCPEKWEEALTMLRFGIELCRIQHEVGRVVVLRTSCNGHLLGEFERERSDAVARGDAFGDGYVLLWDGRSG